MIPRLDSAPDHFVASVQQLRALILSAPFLGAGADADKGLEYLFGLVDYSLRLATSDDPRRPHLIRTSGVRPDDDPVAPDAIFRRNGLDNPDNDYLICSLDPEFEYRVTGTRGSIAELNFQLLDGNYSDRTDSFAANMGILPSGELAVDEDGRFEMVLSSEPQRSRNGLVMPPETRALIVRRSYSDWGAEVPGALSITRVGDPDPEAVLIDHAYWTRAESYLRNTVNLWLQFGPGVESTLMAAQGPKSRPFNVVGQPRRTPGGFPDQYSVAGRFRLEPDEVVVLTMDHHGAAYHSVQLGDYWFTSLRYVHRQSSLNRHQYRTRSDGRVAVVISASDPGVSNWLDTDGLREGFFFVRWQGLADGVEPESPEIRVVGLNELDPDLIGGAIDADERKRLIERRVESFGRRESAARRVDWGSSRSPSQSP